MRAEGYIPKVDPAVIIELAGRIRPCVVHNCQLHFIKHGAKIFNQSFLWDAVPDTLATGLTPIQDITTYHTWGHYMLFKPSIAEVIAQITQLPAEVQARVVAFELIHKPENATDLNDNRQAMNDGYHVATARLYAKL